MDAATRHDWVERAVRVVAEVFPSNEIAPWSLSQRYVLNALTCLGHAEQVQMESHNVWLLRYNVARYLSQRGQYTEAEVLYQQVLSSSEKLLGTEHPETLNTRHALALLYKDQGKYTEAEVLYQQVLSSQEKLLGTEHPHTLGTRHNQALLFTDQVK